MVYQYSRHLVPESPMISSEKLLATSLTIKHKRLMESSCHLSHLSVCWPVCWFVYQSGWKVYCGKTANWIQMLFGMVSGVGRGMGVLDGAVIIKGEGAVLG